MKKRSYRDIAGIELHVVADLAAIGVLAAREFIDRATKAIKCKGRFSVAFSGGQTPKEFFTQLASASDTKLNWTKIHVFWGDERHVAPTAADSNYRLAKETLLDHLQIPDANIHRIRGEDLASSAAYIYENDLRRFFNLAAGAWPRFDLIFLGLGEDGHTASLFPGTVALHERVRLVTDVFVARINTERITLTYPVINAAACVLVLASGTRKALVVEAVLNSSPSPDKLPMQGVLPSDGQLLWIVDASAAGRLHFLKPSF